MKVSLVNYTPDALTLLLDTKNTRLGNAGDDPRLWSAEKRAEHLQYMLGTIKSSWEFVDYVFRIEGVTRAFTQQLERHRHGSYAEQSLRAVDASQFPVSEPLNIEHEPTAHHMWHIAERATFDAYEHAQKCGIPLQDARGILPININTNMFAKFNLRSLHEMAKLRLCTRAQGEFQNVFRAMRAAVVAVHPWAADFINVQCVADGTCAFPNYGPDSCPIYHPCLDRTNAKEIMRQRFWATPLSEANPVAKGGQGAVVSDAG